MANFALLIGVDAYMSESRLTSLRSAADAARQMARWLIAENWVVPEQTRLLCAPHDAERGEWPATRSSIAAALGELKRAGAQATPADRLYLLFAGYSAGHFDEQRLLLPHDTDTARLGEQAVPLAALTRWLRGTGFQTQLCMLALANAGVAVTAEALFEARLPESLTTATASWPEVSQVHLLGLGEARVGTAGELPAMFSAVLHKGLAGAARVSIDHETGERVIRLGALRAYLERENAPGDASDWRCITTGRSAGDPIVARLGPAQQGELWVELHPVEAAAQATVTLALAESGTIIAQRTGPPFQFSVLREGFYSISVQASGYSDESSYGGPMEAPHVIKLRPLNAGVLAAGGRSLARLLIQPGDATLPVQLFNSYGYSIALGDRKPRGYIVSTPPDRYRAVLVLPERNIEREVEAPAGETTLLTLAIEPSLEPRALDRLLDALDDGQKFDLRLPEGQAALIVLAQGLDGPLATNHQGSQQQVSPTQIPAGVVGLLRLGYIEVPKPTWLALHTTDGELCQLFVPLLRGFTTIVGLDRSLAGPPTVELLVTKTPLQRRGVAAQRRILWAQRFFGSERRPFVPAIVAGLDDEPLALALAGYASLGAGHDAEAREKALRLKALAPDSGDSYVLSEATAIQQVRPLAPAAGPVQPPYLLNGLQYAVSFHMLISEHLFAPLLFRHAILTQMWVIIRGAPIALFYYEAGRLEPMSENPPAKSGMTVSKSPLASLEYTLGQNIREHFNIGELRELCTELGIDYEDLGGETKSDKIIELISYVRRRGLIEELLSCCRRLRPRANWL